MPLDNCNEAQLKAVKHFMGPMLLIAGPGSGKTFTIIERIRYLIEHQGVEPSEILVITFTRAAALEMEQRFLQAVEGGHYPVNFGTFHAIYFHILKQAYQYDSQNIISEKEKREYLKQILKDERGEDNELSEHLLSEFGKVKNSNGGIETYRYGSGLIEPEEFARIYTGYRNLCLKERKMDFDDMAIQCLDLFKRRKDILETWQGRFPFIMIDEFQDINLAQYTVIRMLAGKAKNVTAVGDDDQSIYGFRGADPSIMKKFAKDFENTKVVMLENNYRSAEPIIRFSMQIIKENKNRFLKTIKAGTQKKGKVTVKGFPDKEKEYGELIEKLKECQKEGRLEECAVICRTNKGVSEIKRRLQVAKIDFAGKENACSIYEHFIMRDVEDYLKFAHGDKKRGRFLRIMNKPSRYFSRDSIEGETVEFGRMKEYYSGSREYVGRVCKLEEDMEMLKGLSPFLAVNYIRKAIGYDSYIKEKESDENLKEVMEQIQKESADYRSVEEWLSDIEKKKKRAAGKKNGKKEPENFSEEKKSKVTVITMHGSKGLEYGTVFLPDVNEGTVPYGRMLPKEAEEEERRIFYVAVTRAKENLEIFYVENKDREKRSRFLPGKREI